MGQAGGGSGVGDGCLGQVEVGGGEGEDETGGKGIAAANAVDYMVDLIGLAGGILARGEEGLFFCGVVEHGSPVIV